MTVPLASLRQEAPASPRFRPDPGLRRAILLTALTLTGLVLGLLGEYLLASAPLTALAGMLRSNVASAPPRLAASASR